MRQIINYIDLGVHYGQEIDLLLTQFTDELLTSYELHIYGIEANTLLTDMLIDKYQSIDHVKIFNYAIANSDLDTIKLYLANGSLGSSIYATKYNVTSDFIKVQSIRLSTFISNHIPYFDKAINILKLNIEGAEMLVYQDLINTNLLDKINLLCGHPTHDIEKVEELHSKRDDYYKLLQDNNIKLEYFCAETGKDKCINVFDYIKK